MEKNQRITVQELFEQTTFQKVMHAFSIQHAEKTCNLNKYKAFYETIECVESEPKGKDVQLFGIWKDAINSMDGCNWSLEGWIKFTVYSLAEEKHVPFYAYSLPEILALPICNKTLEDFEINLLASELLYQLAFYFSKQTKKEKDALLDMQIPSLDKTDDTIRENQKPFQLLTEKTPYEQACKTAKALNDSRRSCYELYAQQEHFT